MKTRELIEILLTSTLKNYGSIFRKGRRNTKRVEEKSLNHLIKFLIYNHYKMSVTTKEKSFSSIDERSFNLKETREIEEKIDIIERLQFLASISNNCKKVFTEAYQQNEQIKKNVEYYNYRVDMINEAIDELKLDRTKLERIELPEGFHIDDKEISNVFPKIEIK